MADEAFALSPISARAVQPSEEDYEAISHAFMETSRGRWFLGEYSKRNRNSDTRMVLDAVARIEQSLVEQKQPVLEDRLPEALAAISRAVDLARAAATQAIDGLVVEQHLAPARKGIRVIKEISWRWREIGADSRICDLIDTHIAAIEAGCEQMASADPKAAVSSAFDLISQSIGKFSQQDAAPPPVAAGAVRSGQMPAAVVLELAEARSASKSAHKSAASGGSAAASQPNGPRFEAANAAPKPAPVLVEAAEARIEIAERAAEAAEAERGSVEVATEGDRPSIEVAELVAERSELTAEDTAAEAAFDEAILDLVAQEMAAPDLADGDIFDADGDEINDPASLNGKSIIVPRRPEPAAALPAAVAASAPPRANATLQPLAQPSLPAQPQPSPAQPTHVQTPHQTLHAQPSNAQPSLGSTLIANGIVRRLPPAEADPLAPIRRMSQAERIAFFS